MLAYVPCAPLLEEHPEDRKESSIDSVVVALTRAFGLNGAHDVLARLIDDAMASPLTGPSSDHVQRAVGYIAATLLNVENPNNMVQFYTDPDICLESKWYSIAYAQLLPGWSNLASVLIKQLSLVLASPRLNPRFRTPVLLNAFHLVGTAFTPDVAETVLSLDGACSTLRWHVLWVLAKSLLGDQVDVAAARRNVEMHLAEKKPFGHDQSYAINDVVKFVSPYNLHDLWRFSEYVATRTSPYTCIEALDGCSLRVWTSRTSGMTLSIRLSRQVALGCVCSLRLNVITGMINLKHWQLRFPDGVADKIESVRVRIEDPVITWIDFLPSNTPGMYMMTPCRVMVNPNMMTVVITARATWMSCLSTADIKLDDFDLLWYEQRRLSELTRLTASDISAYLPDVDVRQHRIVNIHPGFKVVEYDVPDAENVQVEYWGNDLDPVLAREFVSTCEENLDMRLCVCAPHLEAHIITDVMNGMLGFVRRRGLVCMTFEQIIHEAGDPTTHVYRWRSPARAIRLMAVFVQVLWMMRQTGIVHGFITPKTVNFILKPDTEVGSCYIENFLLDTYNRCSATDLTGCLPERLLPETRTSFMRTRVYKPTHLDDQYAVAVIVERYATLILEANPDTRTHGLIDPVIAAVRNITGDDPMRFRSAAVTDSLMGLLLHVQEQLSFKPGPPDTLRPTRHAPDTDT